MSSDAARPDAQAPSPAGLQELIDALKAASLDVSETRRRLDADYAGHVVRVSAEAARGVATAQASVDAYKRDLNDAVDAAKRRLTELEARSSTLAAKLSQDLAALEPARARLEAGLDAVSSATRQVRADRDASEAEARAREAQQEAVVAEMRRSLADYASRIATLEAENQRLAAAAVSMEERVGALEKKKVFGLF